ncbi:MAG: hypothetical protein HUK22_02270 [Thermoguttaceae bacterium]|nr:hypothetical protein [Thermoguttaceae bacterium]
MRHSVVFDKKSLEKPAATWTTLAFVSVATFLIGGVLILTADRDKGRGAVRLAAGAVPNFAQISSMKIAALNAPTVVAAGWGDECFLADETGVALCDSEGKELDFWSRPSDVKPTGLAFVADETSSKNGALLIAYPHCIDVLYFDGAREFKAPASADSANEDESHRTAAGAALGAPTTIMTLPSADIAGIATGGSRVFIADYASQRVLRYSWQAIDAAAGRPEKEAAPDAEFGDPDQSVGYLGLRPAIGGRFGIAYSAENHELFVANSGLFRVDAFNVDTGAWSQQHSWVRTPGGEHGFHGLANPIAIAVSQDGWIATAESVAAKAGGVDDALQLFDFSGSWLASVASATPSEGCVAAAVSSTGRYIYALVRDGELVIFRKR